MEYQRNVYVWTSTGRVFVFENVGTGQMTRLTDEVGSQLTVGERITEINSVPVTYR